MIKLLFFVFTDSKDVYKKLSNCNVHMKAYMKAAIPDRLYYRNNKRIQPIILMADEGWTIVQQGNLSRCKWSLVMLQLSDDCVLAVLFKCSMPYFGINSALFCSTVGDHGYDNSLPSMQPFLAAQGPAFRKGYRMKTINSVDLYPLMCNLLGIPEMPNNGSFTNVRCVLLREKCSDLAVVVGIVIGSLIVLTTITLLFKLLKNRDHSSSRPFARLELEEDDDEPLLE